MTTDRFIEAFTAPGVWLWSYGPAVPLLCMCALIAVGLIAEHGVRKPYKFVKRCGSRLWWVLAYPANARPAQETDVTYHQDFYTLGGIPIPVTRRYLPRDEPALEPARELLVLRSGTAGAQDEMPSAALTEDRKRAAYIISVYEEPRPGYASLTAEEHLLNYRTW